MTVEACSPRYAAINILINGISAGLLFGATRISKNMIKIPTLVGVIGINGLLHNWKDKDEFSSIEAKTIVVGMLKSGLDLAFFILAAKSLRSKSIIGKVAGLGGTSLYGLLRVADSTTLIAWLGQRADRAELRRIETGPQEELVPTVFREILGCCR